MIWFVIEISGSETCELRLPIGDLLENRKSTIGNHLRISCCVDSTRAQGCLLSSILGNSVLTPEDH